MEDVEAILARAKQRALEKKLPYTGALLPKEVFALLKEVPGATLVDVRTQAEWYWVGRVPGAVTVEWSAYPGGARNPDFLGQFRAAVPVTTAPVMFLCRSGQRSHHAAGDLFFAPNYDDCLNAGKRSSGQLGAPAGFRHSLPPA